MRLRFSLVLLAATACSESFLQPKEAEPSNIDNRLTLKGNVCSSMPDPNGFPVKVVLVVDESGSMCVSDPPGSQMSGSFCAQALIALAAAGQTIPTEPARVRALRQLFNQFQSQPNVSVALLPFETNVINPWPTSTSFASFGDPATFGNANARVSMLQSQLGKGTDYQGALAAAYALVSSDIAKTEMNNPELLPRTRYVVVFLTDGTPYPKCAANDMLAQYADDTNPDLLWADSGSAAMFCNIIDPMGCTPAAMMAGNCITGFVSGTDRNQNYQLYAYVDQLLELKASHNIGDVRLHTVLLFNEEAVRNCGTMCQDLYGVYPNVAPAMYPVAAHTIARHILRKLAERGNGIFQEFTDTAGVMALSLGALDYSSLASRNVMKTLMVHAMSSAPSDVDRALDADGDGLIDDQDNDFFGVPKWRSQKQSADTDGDCFDDLFEVMHYDDGFRPDSKDGRGCDPMSPLTLGCACRDTDGDGLSQYAEQYLHTRETVVDSDGDGVPDGLEAMYGLDPLKPQATGLDTDGDGNPDFAEFRADSNPIHRDNVFFDKNGYEYEVTPTVNTNGTVCYDFAVSNIEMLSPEGRPGQSCMMDSQCVGNQYCSSTGFCRSREGEGFNLFKVWFAESPESGVATDYGVWRTACAYAQYAPPTKRRPAGPDLTFVNTDFKSPPTMVGDPSTYWNNCVGFHP